MRQAAENEYEYLDSAASPEDRLLGAPVIEVWRFETLSEGETTLTLEYRRPWETGPALNTFSVQVEGAGPFTYDKGPAFLPRAESQTLEPARRRPTRAWTGCRLPTTPVIWACAARSKIRATAAAAGHSARWVLWNWRCWAPVRAAPIRSSTCCPAIQWGTTAMGGLAPYSHQYHIEPSLDPLGPGARYQADFPYTASDLTPCGTHAPQQTSNSWDFVDDPTIMPTVSESKTPSTTTGQFRPRCAPALSSSPIRAVSSPQTRSHSCGGRTNHAIILTGWDDSQGVWILKNSWGPGWGDNEYMGSSGALPTSAFAPITWCTTEAAGRP